MDLRRLFPLDCKPPLAHENHSRGKYLGAKYRPESLRDVGFSSAVTFPSRRQIRRLHPMTRLPVCLRARPSRAAPPPLLLLCGGRVINHSKLCLELQSGHEMNAAPPSVSCQLSCCPRSAISCSSKDKSILFETRSSFFFPKTEPDV